jgi:putative phosphonate metabolism protein
MQFVRHAIYYTPPVGPLADFGAQWLGWDIATGWTAPHPGYGGLPIPLDQITQTPRRYGFHATLKPPFRLAVGQDTNSLCDALITLTSDQKAVALDGLQIASMGSFLALIPFGDTTELSELAARIVRDLDTFRAPLSAEEFARRNHRRLTATQQVNLTHWGYAHVMAQFRFHMTLTGRLSKPDLHAIKNTLEPALAPLMPQPLTVCNLTLVGEDDRGMFHQIQRFALSG